MQCPSRDHLGSYSSPGSSVKRRRAWVATSRRYRSDDPDRRELNRIARPSGAHRELDVFGPPIEVIWVAPEPSAFAVQISSVPERVEVNVTLVPSAEKSGLWSWKVEAIASTAVRPASEGRIGRRQMFVSECSRA